MVVVPLRRWSSSRFSNRGGSYSTKKKKKREQWKERSHGVGTDRMETAWHGVSLERNSPRRHGREMDMRTFLRVAIPHQLKRRQGFAAKAPAQCPQQQQQQCLSTRPAVGCPRTKSSFDAETVFDASDGATGQCYRTWLFNHDCSSWLLAFSTAPHWPTGGWNGGEPHAQHPQRGNAASEWRLTACMKDLEKGESGASQKKLLLLKSPEAPPCEPKIPTTTDMNIDLIWTVEKPRWRLARICLGLAQCWRPLKCRLPSRLPVDKALQSCSIILALDVSVSGCRRVGTLPPNLALVHVTRQQSVAAVHLQVSVLGCARSAMQSLRPVGDLISSRTGAASVTNWIPPTLEMDIKKIKMMEQRGTARHDNSQTDGNKCR
ncbi:uncharacterized protein B0T23DRAFT_435725 [Neurospora hispaniola]|uniref:Uncharacterized protein n=1 Tax=Neurospora hispaniola TaxID=588809 RepID=A0AAJ0MWD1_9PEZI|nr:hypothetical protein B0T23DRAFT_435725 [Neurospora hispaniola]